MKEKLANLSISTKIILVLSVITVILATGLGIAFATHTDLKALRQSTKEVVKAMNVPNVDKENTSFEISNTEETEESVIIKANSKIEGCKLYYYIEPVIVTEDAENQEENKVQNNEILITDTEYIAYEEEIEIFSNAKVYFKYEVNGEYSENAYTLEINNIKEKIGTEAPDSESVSEEELAKAKVTNKDNKATYYIVVNYGSNVVTVYTKDADGNYTVPVKAMVCSCGTATPRGGIYKLRSYRTRWQPLFGGVFGQYSVPIVGNILFHSVPYLKNGDPSSLEYWEYDKLGTSASAGCIRLTVTDAIWIYNNCGAGTQVEFTASANNPLGKPSARKISGNVECRGYDPTDPVANNPWRNVPEEKPVVSETPVQTPTNTPSPTESPNTSPTGNPDTSPTGSPDTSPTGSPDTSPTGSPDTSPTGSPATSPTGSPDTSPTESPATSPTGNPDTLVENENNE